MPPLPWPAILAAAAAYFVLGAVWYMVLGKPWMAALGKTRDELKPKDPTPFLTAAAGSVINAAALAWLTLAVPECNTVVHAAALGGFVGVGVLLAAAAKHYAFAGWSGRLLLIDLGLDVIGFVAMGAVIGAMR